METENKKIGKEILVLEEKRFERRENEKALLSDIQLIELEKEKLKETGAFTETEFDKIFPVGDILSNGKKLLGIDGIHCKGTFWLIPLVWGLEYDFNGEVWRFTLKLLGTKVTSTYLSPSKIGGALTIHMIIAKASLGLYLTYSGIRCMGAVCLRNVGGDLKFKCRELDVCVIPFDKKSEQLATIPSTTKLGDFLLRRRNELGISRTELSELTLLSKVVIGALESGKTKKLPDPERLKSLAFALRTSQEELLTYAGYLDDTGIYEVPEK